MKTLMLEFSYMPHKSKVKLVRPLFHYDPIQQKMHRFDGGSLSYVWNWKTKTLEPKVVDLENVQRSGILDKERVKRWIKDHMYEFDIDINQELSTTQGIAVDVKNDAQEEVEDSLDRSSIRHSEIREWNESEDE